MRFLRRASIKAKFFNILLLNLAVIGAAVLLLWQWRIEPALRAGVNERQKQLLMRASVQIVEFFELRARRLVTTAEVGRIWEATDEAQRQAFNRLMRLDPQIREVWFVDTAGKITAHASRDQVGTQVKPGGFASELTFQEPMQGRVYYGPVVYEFTAEPFVTVSVPVRIIASEVAGVMIARVSLKTLWEAIGSISAETSGIVSVLDDKGKLIAHPDYSKVLLAANTVGQEKPTAPIAANTATIRSRLEIAKFNWTVQVEEPEAEALGALRAVQWAFFAILGVSVFIAFAFSAFLSGRITRAAGELMAGAQSIAAGNLLSSP
ncbi:MAG: hypothetical protein FJ143_06745 [Deltaproteobacteria bacterium]|nr:hypothetical protein [Deltaproteobacteria bacterium]